MSESHMSANGTMRALSLEMKRVHNLLHCDILNLFEYD